MAVTGSAPRGITTLGRHEREPIVNAIERDGAVIVADVLSAEAVARLRAAFGRFEERWAPQGPIDAPTTRTQNLVRDVAFHPVLVHPLATALATDVLGPDPLLSGSATIRMGAGAPLQSLHSDDRLTTLRRPHVPILLMLLWAISDFRPEIGATRVVPGSHRAHHEPKSASHEREAVAEMHSGSLLVLDGSTWHGAGAHRGGPDRLALAVQYVAGWCRPQQNLMASIRLDEAARLPRRLAEMIGYSLYRGSIGTIDGEDPAAALGSGAGEVSDG